MKTGILFLYLLGTAVATIIPIFAGYVGALGLRRERGGFGIRLATILLFLFGIGCYVASLLLLIHLHDKYGLRNHNHLLVYSSFALWVYL